MSCNCIKLTPQECKEFAMWFSMNWEHYDSTEKGEMYLSKKQKGIYSVDDVFDKWLNT